MIPYERQEKILNLIQSKGLSYIEDIVISLGEVSESTIRRDLKKLEREEKVLLLHGGGIKVKDTDGVEPPIWQKFNIKIHEKERIAAYAASKVNDGDVIYIDASTTVVPMLKYLKNKKITVVTSSMFVSEYIKDCDYNCIVLGGEIKKSVGSIVGIITEKMLSQFHFDKAFLGANGFSKITGVNTPDIREVEKKRIAKDISEETYFLLDSTKNNISTFCKIFELNECHIITDRYSETLEYFESFEIAN